ncbi:hypothetical protein [Streptomyces sp. NPDC059247]|uniref:hypothetical protein n=1 Tax=Streptomyces sp. NPDC059247 TaxID=3346790 RepID=UPI0036953C1B
MGAFPTRHPQDARETPEVREAPGVPEQRATSRTRGSSSRTSPGFFFGGVYGTVLASSLVAALTSHPADPAHRFHYSAVWLVATALAAALAHGYAHFVSYGAHGRHTPGELAGRLLDEWPLVVATLPSVVLLLGADTGLWPALYLEYVILGMNILLLFGWGAAAGRAGGRSRRGATLVGTSTALLGVAVIVANALIK